MAARAIAEFKGSKKEPSSTTDQLDATSSTAVSSEPREGGTAVAGKKGFSDAVKNSEVAE